MAALGSTDYSWRVDRTAFLNTLGYTLISSQKEVEKVRKQILAVNKEDWAVLKMNIYQNKLGKSKDIPKETTVLLVKDLTTYIEKMAESESAALEVQSGVLPVCFDADAGGGRFLAVFTFLNREDGDVKLHPFIIFKGSDSRKNLELTFGRFTEDIRNLEGREVVVKNEVFGVHIKVVSIVDYSLIQEVFHEISSSENHQLSTSC